MLQIKIFQSSISSKKVNGCICLSFLGVDVGAPRIAISEILRGKYSAGYSLFAVLGTKYFATVL